MKRGIGTGRCGDEPQPCLDLAGRPSRRPAPTLPRTVRTGDVPTARAGSAISTSLTSHLLEGVPVNRLRPLLALLAPLALALPAAAHDWWLEPLPAVAAPAAAIELAATVGVAWQGERVRRDPRRIRRFIATDALGERPVDGAPGADPLGALVLRAPGTTVVAFESEPARAFLRPAEFEAYLKEEGLESILALRAERGHADRIGVEQYFRCAKTLVSTPAARLADRAVGLPLELIADGDLTRLAVGGELRVQLLWRGAPQPGVLVAALERQHAAAPVAARTDADGRVELALPHGGTWLVKAVHMVAAPAETRLDWESWWASLTFSAGSAPPPPAARAAETDG